MQSFGIRIGFQGVRTEYQKKLAVPYELSVFRHILQRDLSPLYFPLETSEQTSWYDHLSEIPVFCTKLVHAQFSQSGTLPSIQSVRVRLLDQNTTPIFIAQEHTVYPQETIDGEGLLSHVLEQLSLAQEAVLEWYHWRDERGEIHLELFAQYPLDALTPEERRFHFYQCLLNEQVATAQERMIQFVHETTSVKKARKYIQDHQQDLLTYASQALQYLEDEPPQIYRLSDDYLLPDVYRLILLSLEELIDYLEQQFGQYLDAAAPLPFHHQLVYASRLRQQLQALQPRLRDSPLSADLVTLLEETGSYIERLPTQQAASTQLTYFRRLLLAVDDLESLTDESVTAALFRINFNSPAFVAWFIAQVQDQLESHPTVEGRLRTLYHYRKFCKQSLSPSSPSYQPEQLSVQEQVLAWINEEIAYLREVGEVPERSKGESLPRIKTNLSVPELSLLIRTLFEVEVLPDQTKANVYRHFSQVFDSVGKEEVSSNTLRNHQYQPSRHTISELKSKVIAMMNFLNSL